MNDSDVTRMKTVGPSNWPDTIITQEEGTIQHDSQALEGCSDRNRLRRRGGEGREEDI